MQFLSFKFKVECLAVFFTSTFNIQHSIFDILYLPFSFLCFSFLIPHFSAFAFPHHCLLPTAFNSPFAFFSNNIYLHLVMKWFIFKK